LKQKERKGKYNTFGNTYNRYCDYEMYEIKKYE